MFAGDSAFGAVRARLLVGPPAVGAAAVTVEAGRRGAVAVSGSRHWVSCRCSVRRLPRIWRMMSSGSPAVPSAAALMCPLVHAEVRFCEIDAKLESSPNFESR